ncbi:signal transduction histidine kinase [Candidatus Magnetoovum chiemensis]|nr:signal transduction histidine kinase [Candidatus Magnetoovum chiemensis]
MKNLKRFLNQLLKEPLNAMRKNFSSIVFILSAALMMTIIWYYGYKNASELYRENILTAENAKLTKFSSSINNLLDRITEDISYLSIDTSLAKYFKYKQSGDKKEALKLKQEIIDNTTNLLTVRKLYASLIVFDKNRNMEFTVGDDQKSAKTQALQNQTAAVSAVTEKLEKNHIYISNVSTNKDEHSTVSAIEFTVPIYNKNDKMDAAITLTVPSLKITEMLNKVCASEDNGQCSYMTALLDNKKRLIASNSDKMDFQINSELKEGFIISGNIVTSFKRIYPLNSSKGYYWTFISQTDANAALSRFINFKYVFFAMLALSLIVLAFLGNRISRSLYKSLSSVSGVLGFLARGEIPKEQINYQENNEIGTIAANLNMLTAKLKRTAVKLKALSNGNLGEDLLVINEKDILASSVNQIIMDYRQMINLFQETAAGSFNSAVRVKGDRDILNKSIAETLNNLNELSKNANLLAKGDYSVKIEPLGDKDELSSALLKIKNTLLEYETRYREEMWLVDGISALFSALEGKYGIHEIARKSLQLMSEYTNSTFGALYSYDDQTMTLKQASDYALDPDRGYEDEYSLGEGVIGQVGLQKRPILLKSSEQITTNNGEKEDVTINTYTFPLIYNSILYAVVEVASYEEFTNDKIKFLEKAGAIVSIYLFTMSQLKLSHEEKSKAVNSLKSKMSNILRDGDKTEKYEKYEINDRADNVILIIEEDVLFSRKLKENIIRAGYKALVTFSAANGINLARTYRPLGIILDTDLSDTDNLDTIRELTTNPLTEQIPVLVVSDKEYDNAYIRMGAIGFIQKPIIADDTNYVIKQLLQYLKKQQNNTDLIIEESDE